MPSDIPQSLTQTLVFYSNLQVCRSPKADFDADQDYLIFDNQQEADYHSFGRRDTGRDGKVNEALAKTVHLCHVGWYKLTFRDLLAEAAGHLNVGDIRAEISTHELDGIEPKVGDELRTGGKVFKVFAVDFDVISSIYIVWSRA